MELARDGLGYAEVERRAYGLLGPGDVLDGVAELVGRIELEPVDLTSLVREQSELFFAHAPEHAFELDAPREPVVVNVDHDRIAQVIGNLLSNAIRFSPSGGLVRAEVAPQGDGVRLAVTDEGVGIPQRHRPRIFERFYRGAAQAAGIGGTGLGLAVAREIVGAHGGKMGFDREEGIGSTFWLELPLRTTGSAAMPVSERATR